ncbi:MAG TPA: hypothetical protein VF814_13735 [Casimicrobiaceae bacterium]
MGEDAMDSPASVASAAFVPTAWAPIDFVVAVWLGMSHQDIVAGLADGRIIPPAGEPVGWIPPAWANEELGAPATSDSDPGSTAGSGPSGEAGTNDSDAAGTNGSGGSETNGSGDSETNGSGDFALDREHVAALYTKLDPSLSDAAFEALWNRVGATDDARAEGLFGYLRRALLDEAAALPSADDPAYAAALDSQASVLGDFLSTAKHQGTVVDLAGKDGAELLRLAKTDPGYRYALEQLDSMAIVGNRALTAIHDANGELDRFDPDTGEANLSDAWLSDRAKFLAWKLQTDAGGAAQSDSDAGWTFIDRATLGADGKPLRLDIAGKSDSAPSNQVIFGSDDPDGEMLNGGATTDRLYGGGGDDVVRGNAGDDHVEGGKGADLVLGGLGNDELTGDQGDDDLEGGGGADRLDGGSGDDTLIGGRGDDRLVGGAGHDTYVIDPGDGSDSIVDSDADGELQFDGVALAGATTLRDGKFVSDDGKAVFGFAGDAEEGGTLTITFYDKANPGDGDNPTNTVRVKDWKNGELGIVLGDGSAAALAATAQSAAATDSDSTGTTSATATPASDTGDSGNGQDAGGTGIGSNGDASDATGTDSGGDASGGTGIDSSGDASPGAGSDGAGGEAKSTVTVESAIDSATVANAAPQSDATDGGVTAPPDLHVNPSSANGPSGALLDALLKASSANALNLVRLETVNAALAAFSAIPVPPDIAHSDAAGSAPVVGVTEQDVASAMVDFHDAQHDAAPVGNELVTGAAGIGEAIASPDPAISLITTKVDGQTSAALGGSRQGGTR